MGGLGGTDKVANSCQLNCFPSVKARDDASMRSKNWLSEKALQRGTRKGLEGLGGLRNGARNTARNELCSIAELSKARKR